MVVLYGMTLCISIYVLISDFLLENLVFVLILNHMHSRPCRFNK